MLQILAACIFFTRLPFWRLAEVPALYFKRVVPFWPLTGWLTAGLSVLVFYLLSLFLPAGIALLLAMITRLLVTGCLHEDGLADFMDGFGGGNNREQILRIMKDSHTGTYGVIGLIGYFALFYLLLSSLPVEIAGTIWLVGDPLAKCISAMIINRLPYAREEKEAKNQTVYTRMTIPEYVFCIISGLLPLLWLPSFHYLGAILFPVLAWILLTNRMKKKIQGYTGDCCGATFLLCEVSFYLGVVMIYNLIA
ncbi:MAG: adenosylcobinamide-GDP ribazoletransferase [Tannerellaceae bacterium]|nr:adenosylcobinamide-GDP ribazoletransferase [Tannerellaceae bacterium]